MLSIKFYPESDLHNYDDAVAEYQSIWDTNGEKIVNTLEQVSRLTFKETKITGNVGALKSLSHALTLRYNLSFNQKIFTLTH